MAMNKSLKQNVEPLPRNIKTITCYLYNIFKPQINFAYWS